MSNQAYSPSMVDGKIVRLSVSQLSRFDTRERGGCKRKWWYKYVGKIPDPPKVSQQEGIDGHKRFENYYSGQSVVWFDCDLPALPLLPRLEDGAKPEVSLERLSLLRIPFQGSMDLVHGRDVYDYKYQAQIRAYSEPTAQLWGYLEEVRLRDDSGGRLGFHHVYIKKKAPYKAEKVSQYFEPREVERQWLTYGGLVQEMQQVSQERDADKVEANRDACYSYGPCPYLSICNRNPIAREEEIMGFLEEIEAAKKELAAVALPTIDAKVLPPDGPAPDATPTAPEASVTPPGPTPTPPPPPPTAEPKKRGRPRKLQVDYSKEPAPPDEAIRESYKPKPPILDTPPTQGVQLKALRLGLTIGLPEYSSAHAFVELAGGTEEEMTKQAHEMIMRQLKNVIPAYTEALKLRGK